MYIPVLIVNFIFIIMLIFFSHAMKLLGLIRTLTFSFSTVDTLLVLNFALVRSKLEYASVAWNSVTITDSNKLERVPRKYAALCHKRIFQDVKCHYDNILQKLNFRTLHIRRRHFDALFLTYVFSGTKYCPFILETVGIRVPIRNIRNFTTFSCSFSQCLSAKCVSAANAVYKSTDIFSKSCVSLKSLS
jgi:hypothetical protein